MQNQTNDKPNVLFIMDDQHRFDYLRCAGADFINTPNLDRLASMGARFTNCFTTSPICAPARISLATGQLPSRLGALDNHCFLPASSTTFYQRFRDSGYRVGCIGKLDLAKPDRYNGRYGDRPCAYSFGFTHPEECEGKMHAGVSPAPLGPYSWYLQEKGQLQKFHEDYSRRKKEGYRAGPDEDSVLPTEDFEDIYIGRRAARWLANIPDDFPWFYFVSFVGPHDPFDPPTEYADRYRDKKMPQAVQGERAGKPQWVKNRMVDAGPETVAITRRQYCAATEAIDTGIGWILEALEQRKMLDNTYIIFTSDHGEMLGDHGLYTKHCAYEPSLHVPLIVAGPGIGAGRVSDALVELSDTNPTACELAGLPPQQDIDAKSFVPVLEDLTETHREDAVSVERHYRCIRTREWKLIENYNDINELYDMQNDPLELNNVAKERKDIVRSLKSRLRVRFMEGRCHR
jgi:choline-sulfatase